MDLPNIFVPVETLVGEDEPSNGNRSIDHGTDELPFNALGGRRFEVLGYLLELDTADEHVVVTLVQTASDKGRDLLVHRGGVLARVIQCKNLLKKIGRPDLLVELVKLLLFDETQAFLPPSPLCYEIWAPRGLTERADAMVAEWPNGLETKEVLSAFQKVTATYKTLEHFRWDETGAKLIERLKAQFSLKREDGITLSQRVRRTTTVYQQFFQGIVVLPQPAVDLYLDNNLAPKVAEIIRLCADATAATGEAGSPIDSEIDEAAAYINSGKCQDAVSLLSRLTEKRKREFTVRQLFRVEANLGAALYRLGDAKGAAAHFIKAATLDPEDERASSNEVFGYFLLGENAKAFSLASERKAKFPESGRLHAIWISSAPAETDAEMLQEAVAENFASDPEVCVALARKLLQDGRAADALKLARKASDTASDWPQAHLICAHCAIALNLFPTQMTRTFAERITICDEGILAAGRAQELAQNQGDELTQSQALAARCELYLFAGNNRAATEDAKRAFSLNPKDVSNVLALAQVRLVENLLEAGIVTLEQALEIEPRADVRLMMSHALRARGGAGDLERSAALLNDLDVASLPTEMRPPVAISYVQVLSLLKEWSRADSFVESVRGLLDIVTWQALSAFTLIGTEHPQDAEGRASEALAHLQATTHPSVKEFLARILMKQGRFVDALPLYEELFRSGSPTFNTVQLLECAGRLERDEVLLDTFDELHRRSAVEWPLLEIELHYLHRYNAQKAIDRLNAFLEKNPGHKLAVLQRSAIAWEMGRNEVVVSRLAELPTVDQLPISYIRIALKMLSLGADRDQAVDYAYQFLKLNFGKQEAHAAMIFSVLGLPHDHKTDPNLPEVVEDAAVGYRELPNGALRWTVLVKTDTPDANFEERSVDDAVSKELLGKRVGERFILSRGLQDRFGEIVQILPKQVRRFQDSLTEMPTRFPSESGNFQSVTMGGEGELDLGMVTVFDSVRRRAEQVKTVQEIYRSNPTPIHLTAMQFGANAYEAMLQFARLTSVGIKCCSGDGASLEAAVAAFDDAESIVIDLTSVATFRMLGIQDLLSAETFVISHDSLVELRETLIDDVPDQPGGTMFFEDGRYTVYQEDKEQKQRRLEADKEFFEIVRVSTTMQPSLSVASVEAKQRATLFALLGKYGFETVMLAAEPGAVLLTDDAVQGHIAAANFGVRRTWTHAFLVHLRRKNQISQERFIDAVARLIGMQYASTPFSSAEVLACARLANYDPLAWPFVQATESFANLQNAFALLLGTAIGFFLLLLQMAVVPQNAGRLLAALLEKMWTNPESRQHLPSVRKHSQRLFGLNVAAERAFNQAFDAWLRNRDSGLLL